MRLGRVFRLRLAALVVRTTCAVFPLPMAATSVAVSGCAHTGPTSVAQGLLYAPGEPTYDQYFAALYDVQLKLGAAPEKEAALRQALATTVGAPRAEPAPLLEAVGKQTARMKDAGLTISLAVSEPGASPDATAEVTAGLPEPKDQRVIDAIQTAAEGELELMAQMQEAKAAIAQLKDRAPALEPGIDETFRKQGVRKKSEVRKNLEDAQRLVPLMAQRATELSETAEQMVQGLMKVANTTPESPPEPVPTETGDDADPKKGSSQASPPPRRPRPRPAPKRPSTSDGFEP